MYSNSLTSSATLDTEGRRLLWRCRRGMKELDVLLARPHDLDRAFDVFRDLGRARDAIDLQPPAEPAADQMIVHDDPVERQA